MNQICFVNLSPVNNQSIWGIELRGDGVRRILEY